MGARVGEQARLHEDVVLVPRELDRNCSRRYHRRIVAVSFLSTKTASRLLGLRVIGGGAGTAYALLIIIALAHDPAENEQLANRLQARPGMADRLIMLEKAADWESGEKRFVSVSGDQIAIGFQAAIHPLEVREHIFLQSLVAWHLQRLERVQRFPQLDRGREY